MRRAARIDGNQPELVKELKKIGAVVADTSRLGDGFPDLVVAYKGKNYLVEVKDPSQPPSKRRLTPKEKKFLGVWPAPCFVVETLEGFLIQVCNHEKRVV